MHSKLVALTLAGSGASAFVLPRGDGCCFEVTASGGKSGTVGQLGDGQNRIGGGYPPATYCINNGGITDSSGRGCILTPPTTQFQCDTGASPTTGFSISSGGDIQYNGSGKFYACGATSSEYNIYTTMVKGQKDCVEVTLSSGGKCSGNGNGGGASSSQASIPVGSAVSSKPATEDSTAPAQSSKAMPSGYASSSAVTTPSWSQSKPSAPATGSTEAPPATEGTHAPSTPASKPSSQGPASSPPAVSSMPSVPATQESKPSVPATNGPDTSASMPPASAPPASMSPASMPAVSPSAPAECQPSTVTVTVTQGCGAPPTSMPVVAPSGSVPASSSNGSPSGAVPSAPPASSGPPAAPSTVASWRNGSPSAPAGGSAPPVPASSAAPSADSSKPPVVVPSGQAPSGSTSKAAPSAPSSPTANGSACPTSLIGAYQTPHLVVPISSEQPNVAYGTNYNGQINSTTSTIFNFDIPQDYEGKQCSIIFLFPNKEDLETTSYDFGGSGSLGCTELSSAASQKTSYSNAPTVKKDLGSLALQPGNSYVIATQDCQAGTTQSIELSSQGGLTLNFFEDWNPSPLGLFITSC